MRIQTGLEFRQKDVYRSNQKYNILMFHTKIRGGKTFGVRQKVREFQL